MANTGCGGCIAIKALWAGRAAGAAGWALMLAIPALALAQSPEKPNADPSFPFSREIDLFAKANVAGPVTRDAVLFLGSSSIRLWDVAHSFSDRGTVNRGFGGATTAHVLHYYKRLLPAAPPRAIIVYVGENDLAAGATPEAVTRDVLTLLKRLRADYPRVPLAYLSLKPSPIRWTLRPHMAAVNAGVAAQAAAIRFDYLDVGKALLAADGLPDASLFRPDGLHMNERGYARWTAQVDAWLDALTVPVRAIAANAR
ncbi:lipolytic enzyme [Sphingobium amiense]|uniref:Lipolytic enzyme n=2 Tax=Sphingobium amiense TaxID=135719 RepID=A0A494WE10_9SPHN|nr:lipolytic enzyme [Sphingobium amiense]